MFFRRAKADSAEEETPSTVETVIAEVLVEEPAAEVAESIDTTPQPEPEPVPQAPAAMPEKLTDADVEGVKQEIVQEMIDKLMEVEGAIVPEVVTAPYDPRFPTTNQSRHCFIRYNEYYKCKFERGNDDQRCKFYQRAYQSMCPPEWVEEWEELREQGLWMGKY